VRVPATDALLGELVAHFAFAARCRPGALVRDDLTDCCTACDTEAVAGVTACLGTEAGFGRTD
jgi:hypothetical protein